MTADLLKKLEALADSDPEIKKKLSAIVEGTEQPVLEEVKAFKPVESPTAKLEETLEKKKKELPECLRKIIEFNKKRFAQ